MINTATLARRAFLPMLLLGIGDRLLLLLRFGYRFVGDDDTVIWMAAVDYGKGLFREPYFYGQDYAVMLEALVAAPFTHLGVPLHLLMPTVTAFLALVPFWSFAWWYRKQDRHLSALLFLAMPVLLPVEYGLMTTPTRCFISGSAPLAILPWLTGSRTERTQALLIGLVAAACGFINPNSLVFSLAFGLWFLIKSRRLLPQAAWMAVGAAPFAVAYGLAQAYCRAHPERMMHVVNDWRMVFHASLVPESLGMLGLHFAWLFPVFASLGSLAFLSLPVLLLLAVRDRQWPMVWATAGSMVLILVSFGFAKTHDGFVSFLYPYSRMYLALPLLLCWCMAELKHPRIPASRAVVPLLVLSMAMATTHVLRTRNAIAENLHVPLLPVAERSLAALAADREQIGQIVRLHDVQLLVGCNDVQMPVPAQFRCYLAPLLDPRLPPGYIHAFDRRFWQREAFADSVVRNMLVFCRPSKEGLGRMRRDPRWKDLSTPASGPIFLITGNTLPTDSLMAQFMGH